MAARYVLGLNVGFHDASAALVRDGELRGVLYPMRVRDFSRFGFTEVLFPGLDAGEDD